MVFDEERLFTTNVRTKNKYELYLKFIGEEAPGFKMQGVFPKLWKMKNSKVIGPELINEEGIYRITAIDYPKGFIWINQLKKTASSKV